MPDLYRVTVNGLLRSTIQLSHKTYWLPAIDEVNFQAFANVFGGEWKAWTQELWPPVVTYQNISIHRATEEGPGIVLVPAGWPFACLGEDDMSANTDTTLVRLRRSGFDYPRLNIIHMPPPLLTWYLNGQLSAAAVASVEVNAAFLLGPLFEGGGTRWDAQIYSATYSRSYQPQVIEVSQRPGDLESRAS